MKVGDKYDFKELPWTNGNGHYSESCAVTGSEAVTVPAGTFQTLKIECDGTWTRVFEGSGSGKVTETLWYSPKVNRLVKSAYDDRNAAGKLENRSITELVEFAAK